MHNRAIFLSSILINVFLTAVSIPVPPSPPPPTSPGYRLQISWKVHEVFTNPGTVSASAHVQSMCTLLSLCGRNFLGILRDPGHISPQALIKTRCAGSGRFAQKKASPGPKLPLPVCFLEGSRELSKEKAGNSSGAGQTGCTYQDSPAARLRQGEVCKGRN